MNPPEKVAIGERYARLVVVGRAPVKNQARHYVCQCDCGKETIVKAEHLRSGNTRSCGCLKREKAAANARGTATHGASGHPLFYTWAAMLARCNNPQHPSYDYYGGRGISVCDEWTVNPWSFFAYVGDRPSGLELDRINNDGNYEPGNVRWTTRAEQIHNRRQPTARPRRKPLSEENVAAIRLLASTGTSQARIASFYNLTPSYVSQIVNRKRRTGKTLSK